AIIFVSHYLLEVKDICDHVFVLRDGIVALDNPIKETSVDDLIKAMIGKSLDRQYPKEHLKIGEKIFGVEKLSKEKAFQNISFDLHEGEILGIVGLAGCGKNELIRALYGIEKPDRGEIRFRDKNLTLGDMKDALKNKIAFLPADRKSEGIFNIKSVGWNMLVASLDLITRNFWMSSREESQIAGSYIDKLKIKAKSSEQVISSLSGGNQQKVMLARWLLTDPEILLLEDPTRGIDVNVKTEVYKLITEFVKSGHAVIMVSSDEDEVVEMCDRVIVMRNGLISADVNAADTNVEQIKKYSEKQG
ncbi:MAG TPA: ATP-binding cassette domain-containing protein, partial [Leptolinea sp.]